MPSSSSAAAGGVPSIPSSRLSTFWPFFVGPPSSFFPSSCPSPIPLSFSFSSRLVSSPLLHFILPSPPISTTLLFPLSFISSPLIRSRLEFHSWLALFTNSRIEKGRPAAIGGGSGGHLKRLAHHHRCCYWDGSLDGGLSEGRGEGREGQFQ
jgi:hypothetical protein